MTGQQADPNPSVGFNPTIAASAQDTIDGSRGPSVPVPPPARPGQALGEGTVIGGHYRLERRLGAGGMGEAWEATHTVINKRVALKILSQVDDEGDNQDRGERMLREAKIVASIEHPNIVQIVDFGSTPDGAPYFVMDLVRGSSLRDICADEAPLAWPRARNLVAQIAEALGAAHEQGVVHRDIKPDNVLITMRDADEIAKVIDFGIAKSVTLDEEARRLTRTGAICGTPAFMSPEQIRGEAVDARTDIYSLGCLAYELVVGQRPFPGNTPHELIYGHLFRAIEHVPGELPVGLSAAILRCLQKDPDDRFASMAELCEALAAVDGSVLATVAAEHVPVVVPKGSAQAKAAALRGRTEHGTNETDPMWMASEPPRRGRLVALLAVGILAVGGAVWWAQRPPPETPHDTPPPMAAPSVAGPVAAAPEYADEPTVVPAASNEDTGDADEPTGVGTTGDASDDSSGGPSADAPDVPATKPRRRGQSRRGNRPDRRPPKSPPPTTDTPPEPSAGKTTPKRRPDGTFDLFPD